MTDTTNTNRDELHRDDSSNDQAMGKKKPYVKPSFRYEKVFVTTALSCGKISITEANCVHNLKVS